MNLNRLRRRQVEDDPNPLSEPGAAEPQTERAQKVNYLAGFALIVLGAVAAYLIWPSGIGDVPLASLTLGMLARAFCSVGIAFFAFLFAGALWH